MIRVRRAILFAALGCVSCQPSGVETPGVAPTPVPQGVAADIAYLASEKLGGRKTGTAENDSAAAYIAHHYEHLGLHGGFGADCIASAACNPEWFQFFHTRGLAAQNIAVIIPGTDSALRGRYVIVGAHYDHLGRAPDTASSMGFSSGRGSLTSRGGTTRRTPERPRELDAGQIRPGADDNASGTAALMELGRRLAAHPARVSVLLVHFDAEELGMLGSGVFVDHPAVPRASVILMINLDMVGRLRNATLTVDTSVARGAVGTLVSTAATAAGLRAVYSSEETADRSDHASFGRAGIPAVALFTGMHEDYHRASDVAERINVRGLELVIDVVETMVRALPAPPR